MKILVVILDNIGDMVMGTAVLPAIRSIMPDAQIGMWVKDYAAPVLQGHPLVSFLYSCDPFWTDAPGQGPGSLSRFLKTLSDIRAARYDSALILNAEWRRAIAVKLARIPERIGFDQRKSGLLLTKKMSATNNPSHRSDQHLHLIEAAWGRMTHSAVPSLGCTPEEKRDALAWRAQRGWDRSPIISIHPFSGNPLRWWPLEKWKALVSRMAAEYKDACFLFVGLKEEAQRLHDAFNSVPGNRIAVSAGEPLSRIKALLSISRIFIGNDSGPAHMAGALNIPLVVLFGPTDPACYSPRGLAEVRVIKRSSMAEILVEEVFLEVGGILDRSENTRSL